MGLVVVLAAGAAVTVAGVVLVLTHPTGWTAYSPLSAEQYVPSITWGTPLAVDVVLVAVGAFATGLAAASLRARRFRDAGEDR